MGIVGSRVVVSVGISVDVVGLIDIVVGVSVGHELEGLGGAVG